MVPAQNSNNDCWRCRHQPNNTDVPKIATDGKLGTKPMKRRRDPPTTAATRAWHRGASRKRCGSSSGAMRYASATCSSRSMNERSDPRRSTAVTIVARSVPAAYRHRQ